MKNSTDTVSIANLLGPWVETDWQSGLVSRCKNAWNKPLRKLTNEELSTLLRQRIAVEHLLPIAKARLQNGSDDETEMFDGELQEAVNFASKI